MPDYTVKDQMQSDWTFAPERTTHAITVSKQEVIGMGVQALQTIGSDAICKVCIYNGGSCCQGCHHLADGIGCQQRNTSCTAWLCGFLKLLLHETGLLQEWNHFWDQVPGQGFREDSTPETFFVEKHLHLPDIRKLSDALAADLDELARSHIAIGFIITLQNKMDKQIDQLDECENNPKKKNKINRKIKLLCSPFHRFQKELQQYNGK